MPEVTTTYLHMTSGGQLRARRASDPRFAVRETAVRQWQLNRFLYLFVGEPWAWIDKRQWSDGQWQSHVDSDDLRTFVGFLDASIVGYYELHRDETQAVEIAYFGLAPDFIGRGFGGALLTDAIERAWAWDAQRVWVHTCSLDHPAALKNYQDRGMVIYDQESAEVAYSSRR
jgi:GNAT superfamily N-acetyltransferase